MVNAYCLIFLMALLAVTPVKLTVEFKNETLVEGQPIQAELSVLHTKDQEVNLSSAKIIGKTLDLKFVKETATFDGLKTTYSFELPAQTGGLHAMPPITIEVGGALVRSPYVSFEIKSSGKKEEKIPPINVDGNIIFKIEPFIEGRKIFYPRQRAVFGYRYIFNESIELKEENLPLLEAKGFKNIGSETVENFRRSNFGVREIKQKVEAVTPGRYTIAPSSVQGLPYNLTLFGTKEYYGEPIQADAPGLELEIKAFPEKGRPSSFNGAIGKDLKFRVVNQSFSDVFVGDKITISLEISGDGEVENAPFPDICCQPGFPGRFKQSDIPPAEIFKNGIKFSVIDLYPLSTSVKDIPSVEFSFFNPDTEVYKAIKSDPINITVRPTAEGIKELEEAKSIEPKSKTSTETDWPELNASPEQIDIQTIYPLTPEDLHSRFLGSLASLWLLLLAPLAIFIQRDLKRRIERRHERVQGKEGPGAWDEIDRLPDDSPLVYGKMSEVLREAMLSPDDEVLAFLGRLDEERFSKVKKTPVSELKKEGRRLYIKLKEGQSE